MLIGRRRKTSFPAKDRHGRTIVIDVFVDIVDAHHSADPHAEIEGMKQFQTQDGRVLNWIAKGKCEVVRTKDILVSDDPNAL